jgi:hypothetical protein
VLVRVRAETLELYVGTSLLLTLPRLHGRQQHRIDYRHIIWSLMRKPGAFAQYRFREDLFPSLTFRRAYDALQLHERGRADKEYLRILHLAASTGERDVEAALSLLLDGNRVPTFDATRELVRPPAPPVVPILTPPVLDLTVYDHLLPSRCAHD